MAGLTLLAQFVLAMAGGGLVAPGPRAPQGPPALQDLSAARRDSLERGQIVTVSEKRPGSVWPAVTVYVFVEATPAEAAAVFTDYEYHATYIPTAKKSKISRVIDRSTAEVDYSIALPLVPDEDYTVRDHISRAGPDSYRVDWKLVRASTTRATVGHALFSPYVNARTGQAGTLLEYYNFVTPGSRFAALPFIRSRSIKQIGETARAVARQAEKERGRITEMRPRLTALENAVAP